MESFIRVNVSALYLKKFSDDNSEIIKVLLLKLKAFMNVDLYNGTIYGLGGIGSNGTMKGLMAPISDGKLDIGVNKRTSFVQDQIRR